MCFPAPADEQDRRSSTLERPPAPYGRCMATSTSTDGFSATTTTMSSMLTSRSRTYMTTSLGRHLQSSSRSSSTNGSYPPLLTIVDAHILDSSSTPRTVNMNNHRGETICILHLVVLFNMFIHFRMVNSSTKLLGKKCREDGRQQGLYRKDD